MNPKQILFVLLVTTSISFGQVGIGTTTPVASLDIVASDQTNPINTDGLLIPRVDSFSATNPTTSQQGMLVYLTTTSGTNTQGFYYWDNTTTQWISISAKTAIEDNDQDTKIQVEESTDEDIIRFDTGGMERFRMNGHLLEAISTGEGLFFGEGAGANMDLSSSTYNTFLGYYAGNANTTANRNTAIGHDALKSTETGGRNTAVGFQALQNNITGEFNIALGGNSLTSNTAGDSNVAIGWDAGAITSGDSNIFIGHNAGATETGSDKLYIESSNSATPLIYGEFDNDLLQINGTLNINGNYTFPTIDGTSGQVLTTDGSGVISWGTSSGTDNLGDHTATENIQTDGFWISNDGGNEGVLVHEDGTVGVNFSADDEANLIVGGDNATSITLRQNTANSNPQGIAWRNTGGWYQWAIHRENTNDLVIRGGTGGDDVLTRPEIMRFNSTGVELGGNYTLPLIDGTNGQALLTNGSGVLSWTDISSSSQISDGDNDTKIQVEEATDEDIIRFDMAGTEHFRMAGGKLEVVNTGRSVFMGDNAGAADNLSTNDNTYVGYYAGATTVNGYGNIALGYQAIGLTSDTNLSYTVAIGHRAGINLAENGNVVIGYQAMEDAQDVGYSVGIGHSTMQYVQDGSTRNTAIGMRALQGESSSNPGLNTYMTAIGVSACEECEENNGIAIGYNSTITADNTAVIGNTSISSIGGYANWTNLSDGRFKTNVKEDVIGLDFIMKLRPVSYNLDMNALSRFKKEDTSDRLLESESLKAAEIQTGFIAQEVEQAAKETNFSFHGVDTPRNEKSHYGLRYAEFVVPLVKAVQEQQTEISNLKDIIAKQFEELETIKKMLSQKK